jgi:hypothetical protein
VDSGATHNMDNGAKFYFLEYKAFPKKGSHILVADNHPVPCLGIGTKVYRIDGKDIGLCQVLHVPALKASLISV